jgi:hypothetical protein
MIESDRRFELIGMTAAAVAALLLESYSCFDPDLTLLRGRCFPRSMTRSPIRCLNEIPLGTGMSTVRISVKLCVYTRLDTTFVVLQLCLDDDS